MVLHLANGAVAAASSLSQVGTNHLPLAEPTAKIFANEYRLVGSPDAVTHLQLRSGDGSRPIAPKRVLALRAKSAVASSVCVGAEMNRRKIRDDLDSTAGQHHLRYRLWAPNLSTGTNSANASAMLTNAMRTMIDVLNVAEVEQFIGLYHQ